MAVPLRRKVEESWKLDVKNYREEITREIKKKKRAVGKTREEQMANAIHL